MREPEDVLLTDLRRLAATVDPPKGTPMPDLLADIRSDRTVERAYHRRDTRLAAAAALLFGLAVGALLGVWLAGR